jgi:hypothetical protein
VRGGGLRVALGQRGTPAEEHQIRARKIKGRHIAHRQLRILVGQRRDTARIVEGVQF